MERLPLSALDRHAHTRVRSAADGGLRPRAVDGTFQTAWVVLDYFDVILHVMRPDARDRYDLETLWGDAPRIKTRARKAAGRGK